MSMSCIKIGFNRSNLFLRESEREERERERRERGEREERERRERYLIKDFVLT